MIRWEKWYQWGYWDNQVPLHAMLWLPTSYELDETCSIHAAHWRHLRSFTNVHILSHPTRVWLHGYGLAGRPVVLECSRERITAFRLLRRFSPVRGLVDMPGSVTSHRCWADADEYHSVSPEGDGTSNHSSHAHQLCLLSFIRSAPATSWWNVYTAVLSLPSSPWVHKDGSNERTS